MSCGRTEALALRPGDTGLFETTADGRWNAVPLSDALNPAGGVVWVERTLEEIPEGATVGLGLASGGGADPVHDGSGSPNVAYLSDGSVVVDGQVVGHTLPYGVGDAVGLLYDRPNAALAFYLNGQRVYPL